MKKTSRIISAILLALLLLSGCGGIRSEDGGSGLTGPSVSKAALQKEDGGSAAELPSYYEELELGEYIRLGDYKGLEYEPSGDRNRDTVEYGDSVTVEVMLEPEGSEASLAAMSFIVGNSGFLDGFDELIEGEKIGSTVSGDFIFPDDSSVYGDSAGKKVRVSALIKILDLSRYREADENAIWERVVAGSEVLCYPEDIVKMYAEDYRKNYEAFARQYGMSLDGYCKTFFGFGEDELGGVCLEDAGAAVKEDLVMYAIMEEEGLTLSEGELDACKLLWLETYGFASEEDMPAAWDDEGVRRSLGMMAALRKTKSYLYTNAVPLD